MIIAAILLIGGLTVAFVYMQVRAEKVSHQRRLERIQKRIAEKTEQDNAAQTPAQSDTTSQSGGH